MKFRFLHTGDWHLGMPGSFLKEDAQERYTRARFDAVRTMGQIAKDEQCQFMVVCGDAFDDNQVDKRTILRAIDVLKDVPVPVYILPGNHDPLDAASVFRSPIFIQQKPGHVHVVEDTRPVPFLGGLELVGAPWTSKRPTKNPIEETLASLSPASGLIRIVIGHGAIDYFAPQGGNEDVIEADLLERAVLEDKAHFIGLCDRHSVERIGRTERIWYSGTPEPTRFDESRPGYVVFAELDNSSINVREIQVGHWQFIFRERVDVNTGSDIQALSNWLDEIRNKECARVKLTLVGTLTLSLYAKLQSLLEHAEDVFGSLEVIEDSLITHPDDTDFADLRFSGFADGTVRRLRDKIQEGGSESSAARDALMLLIRLTKEAQ